MKIKNEKNTIWIYALILFSCAFMILLLTFYSQEKLQNNQDKFNTQISKVTKTNQNVITNLKTARDLNKKLQNEINDLKVELENAKKENSDIKLENEKKVNIVSSNQFILNAVDSFISGNYIKCAEILIKIDKNSLTKDELKTYNLLTNKSFYSAARASYLKAQGLYNKKNYEEAINEFNKTIRYGNNFYFSDDVFWFIGNSYLKIGDNDKAKAAFDEMNKLGSKQ